MLKFTVLGQRLDRNSRFRSSPDNEFLVDAGLSARELTRRLAEVGGPMPAGCDPGRAEHGDHSAGFALL